MEPMNGFIHFLTSRLVNNILELAWKIKKKRMLRIQREDKWSLETNFQIRKLRPRNGI